MNDLLEDIKKAKKLFKDFENAPNNIKFRKIIYFIEAFDLLDIIEIENSKLPLKEKILNIRISNIRSFLNNHENFINIKILKKEENILLDLIVFFSNIKPIMDQIKTKDHDLYVTYKKLCSFLLSFLKD